MSDLQRDQGPRRDEHIVSAANPTIKLARSLLRRRVRQRERAILVEGTRAITAALNQGATLRAVLIDEGRRDQIDAAAMLDLRAAVSRLLFVTPDLFISFADTEHPQPVIAICEMPKSEIPATSSFVLVIDGIRDPGNLGTLIRAAAAAGIDGVALLPGTVDQFNSKSIRASAGSVFAIPVSTFRNVEHVSTQCFEQRPTVVVADGDGDQLYDSVDWKSPSMLIIGGEASGSGEQTRTYADIVARIPIVDAVESLNAALAGGIMLFEARRQRGADPRNTRTDADSALGSRN